MIRVEALAAVFQGSLKLRREESCLIVTDTVKENIGRAFFEYARKITPRAKLIVMDPTKEHAAEPPADVKNAMLQYDVQMLITDKSLTHTAARIEASSRGARIATMPGITEEIANRCLEIDYADLKKQSNRLYDILSRTKKIRVTTEKGTDITFIVGKSKFFGKDGGSFDFPGAYGNLPEGEVSFAPADCKGRFIVDASFPELGILAEHIIFSASGGVVNEITGYKAEEIIRRLDSIGPRAYKVAELGIGLNPRAVISGQVLEDEKVIGTVHIALGNNMSYGGNNDVPLHLDGVISNPDIYVDGGKLMENGRFTW
ncbi:MAG: aminopeptidase [Candidatus Omnitrophota bacterium]